MRKRTLVLLFVGTIFFALAGYSGRGVAEVNVNIGINVPLPPPPPPPLVIPAPPPMFVIPRTYVYFAPQVDVDIFFYHGYWYRPHHGHWYRASGYNGSWVYIAPSKMPHVLVNLPPNFRHVPPGHQRIPYGQLKKNWRTWEKEKYWDKHEHEHKYQHEGRERHDMEKWEHKQGKGRGKGKHDD